MALSKIVKINDKLWWALWKIDAPWQEMLNAKLLLDSDILGLSAVSHDIKKAEFLASRLALRSVFNAFGVTQFDIYKDDHGKPYVDNPSYHVSLANSYPYAVAALHLGQPNGIDIEKPADKLLRVQHKFLKESEVKLAKNHTNRLCLAWCVKECIYKIHGKKGLSLKNHIRLSSLPDIKYGSVIATLEIDDPIDYLLHVEQLDGYFIVFNL